MAKNFRLYIKEPLAPGKTIILEEEQTHYLKNVVKYTAGDTSPVLTTSQANFPPGLPHSKKDTPE